MLIILFILFLSRVKKELIVWLVLFMTFLEFMSSEFVKFKYFISNEFTKNLGGFVRGFKNLDILNLFEFSKVKR